MLRQVNLAPPGSAPDSSENAVQLKSRKKRFPDMMFPRVFIAIFIAGKGSRSSPVQIWLFVSLRVSGVAPGTILELFWVALGVSWGCILAACLVTLGSNGGPKGNFCMMLGVAARFLIIFYRNCARFSLASLGVLCFTFSLLFLVSSLFVFLAACSLCLRRCA